MTTLKRLQLSRADSVRERPILFSGPMITALLAGTKSQTRRVMRNQPVSVEYYRAGQVSDSRNGAPVCRDAKGQGWTNCGPFTCPYGQPGDRLWVREAFSLCKTGMKEFRYVVLKDGTQVYESGETFPGLKKYAPGAFNGIKWKPSIHMPRWASRLTLEIVSVRVERVQEISERDAWAEGFDNPEGTNRNHPDRARYWFKTLWNEINAERDGGKYSWSSNPFVWVLSFKRMQQPGKLSS